MRSVPILILTTLLLAGCGSDDGAGVRTIDGGGGSGSASGSGPGSGSGSGVSAEGCEVIDGVEQTGTEVHVTLDEWEVVADPERAASGVVSFETQNAGDEAHELVIARAENPADLPTVEGGAVDEEALGEDLIGEIEAFPAGETCEGSFDLPAGEYALFCAIVEEEDGVVENHYELGMHTGFTVSEG